MVELAIVAVLSTVVGVVWAAVARSTPHGDPAKALSDRVGDELVQHRGLWHLLRTRFDRRTASGFALTLTLAAVVTAGIVLGVFIAMIRAQTGVVNVDVVLTRWAASHSNGLSLAVFGWVTWAGSTIVIAFVSIAAAAYAVWRWRRWSPALFLLVVVVGQFVLSNAVKFAVARVRPDVPPLHVVSGPSFPSGHATAAAATWGAVALVLGRSASPRTRAALAGGAAGIALAVACSRVFVGAHWSSDVIGGLLLGWTWFAVCAVMFGGRVLRLGEPAVAATSAPPEGPGEFTRVRSGAG